MISNKKSWKPHGSTKRLNEYYLKWVSSSNNEFYLKLVSSQLRTDVCSCFLKRVLWCISRVSYKDFEDFLHRKSIENVYFLIRKSIENAFPLMRNPLKILFQNWKSIWISISQTGNSLKSRFPKMEIHSNLSIQKRKFI